MGKKKTYGISKFINDIHLWLGIASGIIVFIVCLTGTIYVFRGEIEKFIEPDKYHASNPDNLPAKSPEALLEMIDGEIPGKPTAVYLPSEESHPFTFTFKNGPEDRRGTKYLVNQYTGEVLGNAKGKANEFFMFIFRMHRWLLLPTEIGRPVVGVATIIFCVLCLTGLVLWWPKRLKNARKGLRLKLSSGWKRINYDLHNVLGFYSLLILLVMGLSGLCWSFEWYKNGLGEVLGAKVFNRGSQPEQPQTPASGIFTVEDYAKTMAGLFPYEGITQISLPDEENRLVNIRKHREGFFDLFAHDSAVIDKGTLEVMQVNRFADLSLGAKIAGSIHAIHLGNIFGVFSKIIYFIACLIGTSLPITGTIIWINKLKKKSRKNRKKLPLQKSIPRPALSTP